MEPAGFDESQGTWSAPAPHPGDPDRVAFQVIKELIGRTGPRPSRPPIYRYHNGQWRIVLSFEDPERAKKVLPETIEALLEGEIDPILLAAVGREYLENRLSHWLDPSRLASDLGMAALHGDARVLLELPERIEALDRSSIARAARRIFRPGSTTAPPPVASWRWQPTRPILRVKTVDPDPHRIDPLAQKIETLLRLPSSPTTGLYLAGIARPLLIVLDPHPDPGPSHRAHLIRWLHRRLVLEEGVGYAPFAWLKDRRLRAAVWTSPQEQSRCQALLSTRGPVRTVLPLAREGTDW